MTENFIIINDDENNDLRTEFNYTSPQMTVDDPGIECENIDEDTDDAAYTAEGVVDSDLNSTAMS